MLSEGGGFEEDDEFTAPTDSGFMRDGGEWPKSQAMPSPRDRIWAIAFKINVAFTVISVRSVGNRGLT